MEIQERVGELILSNPASETSYGYIEPPEVTEEGCFVEQSEMQIVSEKISDRVYRILGYRFAGYFKNSTPEGFSPVIMMWTGRISKDDFESDDNTYDSLLHHLSNESQQVKCNLGELALTIEGHYGIRANSLPNIIEALLDNNEEDISWIIRKLHDYCDRAELLDRFCRQDEIEVTGGFCDGDVTKEWVECTFDLHSYNNGNLYGYKIHYSELRDYRCCDDCGDKFTEDYYENEGAWVAHDDRWACGGCLEDNYGWCEGCDCNISYDRMNNDENGEMCDDCYGDAVSRYIHEWNYVPHRTSFLDVHPKTGKLYDTTRKAPAKKAPAKKLSGKEIADSYKELLIPQVKLKDQPGIWSRKTKLHYGIELEVECRGDYADSMYDRSELAGEIVGDESVLYCKKDGSLNQGMELVSHPMTFDAVNHFDWENIVFKHRGDIQGYHTQNAGMHVHMSRIAFTDNHLLKFMTMIHSYMGFTHLISQRKKTSEYNNFSRFLAGDMEKAKARITRDVMDKKERLKQGKIVNKMTTSTFGEKYVPVNLQHNPSIEVRIFKSNLVKTRFLKNVEYCDSLYYFTRERPPYKLKLSDYVNYIRAEKKRYLNLNKFLDENIIKLNRILEFPLNKPDGMYQI